MVSVKLTDTTFQEEVLKSKQPVLVAFLARWSGSCHIIVPALREVEEEYRSRVKFCKLDVDSHAEMIRKYGVQRVPTILLFRDGWLVDYIIGVIPKIAISQKLNALLGPDFAECGLYNLSRRFTRGAFGERLIDHHYEYG